MLCAPFAQRLQGGAGGAMTVFCGCCPAPTFFDLDCLTRILQKPAAYVGMMGSRGRAALVRRQLLENGLDSQRIDALCAPSALPLAHRRLRRSRFPFWRRSCRSKMPAPRPRAIPSHCWMHGAGRKSPYPGGTGYYYCAARLHPAGCGRKNARSARWQYSGQCGRRHYGALHGTGGSEAVSTGCARLAMLTAFG